MADTKITALTAISTNPVNPATFPIPMVDLLDTSMAASGTTKKVTVNQILGAGGTATLASAAITGAATVGTTLGVTGASTLASAVVTGALTVDTSTLVVDPTNDRVGIGTASPADTLDVNGRVTALRYLSSSSSASLPSFAVAAGNGIYNSGTNQIGFAINSANAMTLNASGNLAFPTGKGIDFSAVTGGTGTATANVLNDYEEGTWVGTIGGTTTNPTTAVTSTGRYTKIGRQVFVEIGFYGDTAGASGRINVSGLPFTSNANLSRPGIIIMDTMGTFTGSPVAYLGAGVTSLDLFASNSNAAYSNVTHNAGAGRALYIALTYTV